MPGIDFKQRWTTLRRALLATWQLIDDWLERPQDVTRRGLVASGILPEASPQTLLGLLRLAFVWIAVLPLMLLLYFPSVVLAIPFILVWHISRFVVRVFMGKSTHSAALPSISFQAPKASVLAPMNSFSRPPARTWLQRIWFKLEQSLYLVLTTLAVLFGYWLFYAAALLGLVMWLFLLFGALELFAPGYTLLTGRDDNQKDGFFTAECIHTNLSGPHRSIMVFTERATRDAYSCPWIRKITTPEEGITKDE